MNLWAFRFVLWYICIMLVQPQNRFTFLWPLHIADLSFIMAVCLHVLACLQRKQPILRLGAATGMALALMFFSILSLHFGKFQSSSAWNGWVDYIIKNALLLVMVEAMATTVERVWAVQMTTLFCTLWWVKSGLRLSQLGATYTGDRLMGGAVSLIENPNGFAYMMCIFLPIYLYAFQQSRRKWGKIFFLFCALAAVYIVFQTGSRTGLLTLIAIGAFLVPHYARRRLGSFVAIAVAIVLIFPLTGEKNKQRFATIPQSIAVFLGGQERERLGPPTQDEQSADERRAKNRDTWALIKENLIFGVGISADTSKFADRFPMTTGQVHCEILTTGKQMGLVGMGLYMAVLLMIFAKGWRIRRLAIDWPAVRDLGWTFQAQAVAIMVGGAFSPAPWHAPMMLLAGSASALGRIMADERAARMSGARGM